MTVDSTTNVSNEKSWIRGVNIGGWLVLERFITPYLFAITNCHIEGNFCWYPGQISAPPSTHLDYEVCDLYTCKPHLIDSILHPNEKDYPVDEWTLMESFNNKATAKRYLQYHWEYFVTLDDVQTIKDAGLTHVRVPIPHFILGNNIQKDEPYVDGGWLYFIRFVNWCRKVGLEVWPDLHTAPGSQNGFDNSGHLLQDGPTCKYWSTNEDNVKRTLQAIEDITARIVHDGLQDVITGFGILNEPFQDCDKNVVQKFNNQAYEIIKENLPSTTAIYIGDMFNATQWNNGWWTNSQQYSNTYLDSHYYHVFAEKARELSPKQHIAYLCAKNHRDTIACCYDDSKTNTNEVPSKGISRIIGEWCAAYDTLPEEKLFHIMKGIAMNYQAPDMDRTLSKQEQAFLIHFVMAQMVVYEAADIGVSSGWFYWTLKMEGGAFAEWDFLRGLKDGWIPKIPDRTMNSVEMYGTCEEIVDDTDDDISIINEYPDPKIVPEKNNWQGVEIDDDYVLGVGGSNKDNSSSKDKKPSKSSSATSSSTITTKDDELVNTTSKTSQRSGLFPLAFIVFFCFAVYQVFFRQDQYRRQYGTTAPRYQYTQVESGPSTLVV